MIRTLVCTLLLICGILSCKQDASNFKSTLIDENDSLIVRAYVPYVSTKSNPDTQAQLFIRRTLLDPIHKGYDSLQIRITIAYSTGNLEIDPLKILILKRVNKKWLSEERLIIPDTSALSYFLVYSKRTGMAPKKGWNNFIDKFSNSRLFSVEPTLIEEEGPVLHGPTTIIIEMASVGSYKSYTFFKPDFYQADYWQIKELKKLLLLFDKEFDFVI